MTKQHSHPVVTLTVKASNPRSAIAAFIKTLAGRWPKVAYTVRTTTTGAVVRCHLFKS